MDPWHWWLIAALVLFIFEIFFSDFLLATIGAACIVTSIFASIGLGFVGELAVFCISAVLILAFLRPAVKRWFYKTSDPAKHLVEAMIGKTGTVVDAIGKGDENPGRVKVGGEEWRSISTDQSPIAEGTSVQITHVDGATLSVKVQS